MPPRSIGQPDRPGAPRYPGGPCDPERNAWAGRSDREPCRKSLAWVGAVVPGPECAANLANLEGTCVDLADGTGDSELDALLAAVRRRLAVLALGGAP